MSSRSSSSSSSEESSESEQPRHEGSKESEYSDQDEIVLPAPADGKLYTIAECTSGSAIKRALRLRELRGGKRVFPLDDILSSRLLNPLVLPYPLIPDGLRVPSQRLWTFSRSTLWRGWPSIVAIMISMISTSVLSRRLPLCGLIGHLIYAPTSTTLLLPGRQVLMKI